MKSRFFAVLLLAAFSITLVSCDWFRRKEKVINHEPISGRWQLDSLQAGNDSNIVFAFLAMAMNDSAGLSFEFKKDTLLTFSGNSIDTTLYRHDADKKQLIFSDSTVDQTYTIVSESDSLISLQGNDRSVFHLRRLK